MVRRALQVTLSAAVTTALLWWASAMLTPPSDEALRVQRPAWARCVGSLDMECATIRVPLDHGDPQGATIDLALARLPARHPDERIGSLVLNFGGPGISGVAAFTADPEPFNTLRSRYDIVTFDPRGVGQSAPLRCSPDPSAPQAVDGTPDTLPEIRALLAARTAYADACRRDADGLLPHLTTEATARDLDILRSALGEPGLNYLGYSYGGGLGARYAMLYPDKVRRMVLDAPSVPPTGAETNLDGASMSDEAIRAFVADCVRHPDCPLGGDPGPALGELQKILQDLDLRPVKVAGGELGDALAAQGVHQLLYSANDWPLLRNALAQVRSGNGQVLYDAAMGYVRWADYSPDAATAIRCNDNPTRFTPAHMRRHAELAHESAPVLGPYLLWSSAVDCYGWDTAGNTRSPDPPERLAPVMVVGTTGDPVVPYESVRRVRSMLTGSVLVTTHAGAHTAYGTGDRCVRAAVDAYLLEGRVPAADVDCAAAGTAAP